MTPPCSDPRGGVDGGVRTCCVVRLSVLLSSRRGVCCVSLCVPGSLCLWGFWPVSSLAGVCGLMGLALCGCCSVLRLVFRWLWCDSSGSRRFPSSIPMFMKACRYGGASGSCVVYSLYASAFCEASASAVSVVVICSSAAARTSPGGPSMACSHLPTSSCEGMRRSAMYCEVIALSPPVSIVWWCTP